MRKLQAARKFSDFTTWGNSKPTSDYSLAFAQRGAEARHTFFTTERLSAEPRGNEVDIRKFRTK